MDDPTPKYAIMPASRLRNKYCVLSALRNESDVEQFFVLPLLRELGFGPHYLHTKPTIPSLTIGKARKSRSYIPDYLGFANHGTTKPVLVVDVKHPNESAEDGVRDAQMYASVLRRRLKPPKTDQLCVGVNGHRFIIAHFDTDVPLLILDFVDFQDNNALFQRLKSEVSRDSLGSTTAHVPAQVPEEDDFEFRAIAPVELPAMFEACHRALWKAEKRSPASAFYEFAKLMYVKIDEDGRLHGQLKAKGLSTRPNGCVPQNLVRFSVNWIEAMEDTTDNPIDTILFAQLSKRLEEQIAAKEKKRIFAQGEGINLAPTTIKEAVRFLQHLDLYAVDEDLNGRLFETFLTATMRGEALGQFFTPRSVVKFMVRMANLKATPEFMDLVLDGCCGTGGFLIEAMADLNIKIEENQALTSRSRSMLHRKLRRENLWGIDAGKDPQMARIARLNMLLHKDGGSRIYFADALDKQLRAEVGLPLQTKLEIDELRAALGGHQFTCILSNPPFSMTYERKKPNEKAVLSGYSLAIDDSGKPRASLRSSVMFLERYWDLLVDRGRLITVMDESILNTLSAQPFRKYLLDKFTLKAVISLPRNTFIKAQGSVKTSVLYLEKKVEEETQPAVFMALCENVGHSDSGKERPQLNELPRILEILRLYENTGRLPKGTAAARAFAVRDLVTNNTTLRLDAHYFNPRYFTTMNLLDEVASTKGWEVQPLSSLLRENLSGGETPRGAAYPDAGPKFIRVQNVRPYRLIWSDEDACIDTRTHAAVKRSQLEEGDVVLTITGSYGIAAVVPRDFGPASINQHSVRIRVDESIRPDYLCVFLNSELCRPQIDRAVTGSTRFALDYPSIRTLRILFPKSKAEQRRIAAEVMKKLAMASSLQERASGILETLPKVPSGTL
jgi:type I restriction enzyme M protein